MWIEDKVIAVKAEDLTPETLTSTGQRVQSVSIDQDRDLVVVQYAGAYGYRANYRLAEQIEIVG